MILKRKIPVLIIMMLVLMTFFAGCEKITPTNIPTVTIAPTPVPNSATGDYLYTIDNQEVEITGYTGSVSEIIMPDKIDGLPVTSIGNHAFDDNIFFTSIIMPNSIKKIGDYAFAENRYLAKIILPIDLESIGEYAFEWCDSLTSIKIPSSVKTIGANAFYACNSLEIIDVDKENTAYASIDGVFFNKDKTNLIEYPSSKKKKDYTIPNSVTRIEEWAFDHVDSIESIIVPDSVTKIGEEAFRECTSLIKIIVSNSLTEIGENVFMDCEALTDIIIPEGVISIGIQSFYGCKALTTIKLPNSIVSIGEEAFSECMALTEFDVDETNKYYTSVDGVLYDKGKKVLRLYPTGKKERNYTVLKDTSEIAPYAFTFNTSLASVTIPDSVTKVGKSAFRYCSSLQNITIPSGSSAIEEDTFSECTSLKNIIIPETVKTIGFWAFSGCTSLTSAIISEGVQIIRTGAFSGCTSIKSIFLPESLEIIESQTFELCSSLIQIDVDEKNTSYSSTNGILFNKDKTILIQYPLGRKDKTYTIPNGVASLGEYSFAECKTLTIIDIPSSVEGLGSGAFYNCLYLVSASFFGDAPSQIGDGVFDGVATNFKIYTKKGTTGWKEDIRGMFTDYPEEDYD